ncbi:MAG: hypothetical protein NW237_03680 [Cyanobacteriota bacterium]|nr:hypothetical protein [Cyanobacteriota bacterium]
MEAATIQLTVPYDLLVGAVSSLDVEHKIQLHQLLSKQIAREQVLPRPKPIEEGRAAVDAFAKAVERALQESGMTEDELAEALAPHKSSHLK